MGVGECGLARSAKPFRVDQRIALAFDRFGDAHPRRAQLVDGEFRRAPDVRLVLGKRADAGNPEEGFQSLQKVGLVLVIVGHGDFRISNTPMRNAPVS